MKRGIEGFGLAPQQRRLWLLGRDGRDFRCAGAVLLVGPLDPGRLAASLEEVVARHEILRTTFQRLAGMEVPLQVIGEAPGVSFVFEDGAGFEEGAGFGDGRGGGDIAALVERVLEVEDAEPFDLEQGPVVHARLTRLEAERHVLAVTLPAVCADGWTVRNLVTELHRGYLGLALSEEPLQYVQFSEWQHEEAPRQRGGRHRQGSLVGDPARFADLSRPSIRSTPPPALRPGWPVRQFGTA